MVSRAGTAILSRYRVTPPGGAISVGWLPCVQVRSNHPFFSISIWQDLCSLSSPSIRQRRDGNVANTIVFPSQRKVPIAHQ